MPYCFIDCVDSEFQVFPVDVVEVACAVQSQQARLLQVSQGDQVRKTVCLKSRIGCLGHKSEYSFLKSTTLSV